MYTVLLVWVMPRVRLLFFQISVRPDTNKRISPLNLTSASPLLVKQVIALLLLQVTFKNIALIAAYSMNAFMHSMYIYITHRKMQFNIVLKQKFIDDFKTMFQIDTLLFFFIGHFLGI